MPSTLSRPAVEVEEFLYSNQYGVISDKVRTHLESDPNAYAIHDAMHFRGYIWFDQLTGRWYEEVYSYHRLLVTVSDRSLERLIRHVNDDYGRS